MSFLTNLKHKLFINLSEATADNFEECNAVLEKTFAYAMDKDGFAFKHYSDFVDSLKNIAELGGKTYIVKYKKAIVGTISIKPKSVDRWYYSGDVYELCHFAVLPDYQRIGLGKMLVDTVIEAAKNAKLPIVLSTPEKNVSVIKYYEKNGFHRVRMFFATDHYACRFIMFTGEEAPFTKEEMREKFEESALIALMKHYRDCNEVADLEIRRKWNKNFYYFYKDQPEDIQLEMRKAFRKKGTTPRDIIKNQ